jgi:tetratricopeptide (TPR) repeat protein
MRPFATVTVILFAAVAASSAFGQTKQPAKPKSKAEETAIRAMLSAQDPDSRIKAADDLITKFADTGFKSYALYLEADSYMQKGDADKTIVFAEQAVEADPTNYQALVLLTKTYANTTHIGDLDKAEKLAKIDKYGKESLAQLETAAKPNAQLSDTEWTGVKNDLVGQTYLGLGIGAVFSGKIDDAKADFDKVASMDQDPTDLIRAGRALLETKKNYADAAAYFEKAQNFPGASAQIKDIAGKDLARAQAMVKK